MEILKMVNDSDTHQDLPPEMPEGASIAPKAPSEEERGGSRRRLEESLQPIEEVEAGPQTENDEE